MPRATIAYKRNSTKKCSIRIVREESCVSGCLAQGRCVVAARSRRNFGARQVAGDAVGAQQALDVAARAGPLVEDAAVDARDVLEADLTGQESLHGDFV